MPASDFLFALELSDESHFDRMLADLAGAVLVQVGYQPPVVEELTGALTAALAKGVADGLRHCDLRFTAQAGNLEIVVAYEGGTEWRTTRPLP